MRIQIFRRDGYAAIALPSQDGRHIHQLMGEDTINFSTTLAQAFVFKIGDYLLSPLGGAKYTLNVLPQVKKHSRIRYEYTLSFEAPMYQLRNAQYLFWGETEDLARDGMPDFSLVGTPHDFLYLAIKNANRINPDVQWQMGTCIDAEARELSFNCNYCLEVLHRIAQEFNTEFWFDGNTINMCKKECSLPYNFEYGKGSTLYNIERAAKDTDICTRLYALGSERNLPFGYRSGSARLRLPDMQYLEQNVDKYGVVEHTEIFDDIYPHRTGTVSGIDTTNPLVFSDSAMPFDLMEKNPANPVPASVYKYLLAGAKAKVHFQSGNLAGYEFELAKYDHATKTFTLIPINEKFATPDTGVDGAFALPNQALHPMTGDTYVLVDITLPQSYIDAAEKELYNKASEYLKKNSAPQTEYRVEPNTIAFTKNNLTLTLGAQVHIIDAPLGINRSDIRITSYERTLRTDIIEYSNVVLADAPANNSAARKYEKYEQQKQIDGSTNLAAIANRRSSLIEDVTSNYTTEINGGLILSTLMQMRGLDNDGSLKTNAGISGLTNEVNPVRFWAGNTFENREQAPFRVRHDGSVVALNAMLQGGLKTGTEGQRIEIDPDAGSVKMYDLRENNVVEIDLGHKQITFGSPDLIMTRDVYFWFCGIARAGCLRDGIRDDKDTS